MLLLLCSCKRWLALWLPVFSPALAQDFATWGSIEFKADLAWMNHLSLMCVCYWWKRKEAGILAGWDRRKTACCCPISVHQMKASFPLEPLHCLQAGRLTGLTYWRRICVPPMPCKMWNIQNVSDKYEIGAGTSSLVWLTAIHLCSIHLAIILLSVLYGYCDWKKSSDVVKSLSDLFKVLVILGFVSCPVSEMWFPVSSTRPHWIPCTIKGMYVPR